MSETRGTILELPDGQRIIVHTDQEGTQVRAMDGSPIAISPDDSHAERVSDYAREGGKVVIGGAF